MTCYSDSDGDYSEGLSIGQGGGDDINSDDAAGNDEGIQMMRMYTIRRGIILSWWGCVGWVNGDEGKEGGASSNGKWVEGSSAENKLSLLVWFYPATSVNIVVVIYRESLRDIILSLSFIKL